MTQQDLDRIVRDVLGDLAGEARPAALLDGAVRRARRIRHRRAGAAAVAVLAVVAAIAVPALAGGRDRPLVPSRPSPSAARVSPSGGAVPVPVLPVTPAPARVDLPDGFTATAIAVGEGTVDGGPLWIYNRETGAYVATPYAFASVAPSGTRSVVQTRAGVSEVFVVDLHDLTARGPRQTPGTVSAQMWHPDARTVLDGGSVPGWLHLIDVVSEARTDVQFQAAQVGCDAAGLCGAAWYPGGKAVTVAVFDPSTGAQTGTQVVSVETGAAIRSLPVKGYIAGACSWSADGRYVVTEVRPDEGDNWLEIVEAATGRGVRLPAMANANPSMLCWSSATRLLVPDGGHVRVFTPDGTARQDITVPGAAWLTIGPG